MQVKILEIRDRMTLISALCVDMNPDTDAQRRHLRAYGYPCSGEANIMITHAAGERKASTDPYFWNDRTWATAHHYIIEHWNELLDGDVIDVEFILGETPTKKTSERLEHWL